MKDIKDIICCVVDHGRFVHVARTLGEQYAKVFYTTPEERDCPLLREAVIGRGFPEIERVNSVWDVEEECDLVVFPDIGFIAEQRELKRHGTAVWGCGAASLLESDKGVFLEMLANTDLPVAPHRIIKGLTNLSASLMEAEDVYIKIDTFRGDWETLHWTNWKEMEGVIDQYAVRFGCLKESITFYVFDAIDTEVEDGVDAWCVNGQWPNRVLHAIECKDKALIGTMSEFISLPDEVKIVNEVMGPILQKLTDGGAMKFSTEVRITKDKESFFIDPTCRFGSPPSQGECLLYQNLPDIIYRGAMGEMVEPETKHEFVVQAFVTIDGDRDDWRAIDLDPELDPYLKGGFCLMEEGRLVLTPITEYHSSEVGYLCATGNTMKDSIDNLRELRDMLPSCLKCEFHALADILNEIHEAEASGMPFTKKIVPEPEEIVSGS